MQVRSWCRALTLALVIRSLPAQTPAADSVRAMVDAEKRFCQTGQEQGTRAAFLAFLAEDGIVFRPGPVNGKEVWRKRAETGFDLIWEPTFAVMSRSGDFGYDTGPAKWRASKREEKFSGYGHFISVWRKQKDESWKVALDCGIENPEPTGKTETLRIVSLDGSGPPPTPEGAARVWASTQQKFVNAARSDSKGATLEFAADEIRVYRDGYFPFVGKEAASRSLSGTRPTTFEMTGGEVSSYADLAYTYGKYSSRGDKGVEEGHYLQIWQSEATGGWKLVLDWQQPLPLPPK
jgi:ketosteroid isomerase-like protein